MSEEFSLKITLEGIDDASDEIKNVTDGLQKLGSTNEEVVARAKEVLKADRDEKRVLRAVAEEAEIFSDRVQFMANQLNNVASFAGRVNNLFNQYNTLMTRVNTAQLNYNEALENQNRLLEEVNRRFNQQFTTVDEALQYLGELRGAYLEAGNSTKELDNIIKQLEQSEKNVAKAHQEVANAQQQMTAQMVTMGIQAVGLVPQFMNMVNSFSTLSTMLGGMAGPLNAVKAGFTSLYAAMGPIGLLLIALSIIIPIIITHWDEIKAALERVGQAIWNAIGPALTWLWENILKPLADFLAAYFKQKWEEIQAVFNAVYQYGIKPLWEGLQWFWNNVLVPLGQFLAAKFKADIEAWINAFIWARDMIANIFNKIKEIISGVINWIKEKIDWIVNGIKSAFDNLRKALVGGSIIPDMWMDIQAWTKWGIGEVNKMMSDFGVNVMGPKVVGGISVVVNVAGTNASADEIAQAVSRAILRNLRGMGA